MSPYLLENRSTSLAKTIFSVRSGTLNIKQWNLWNYNDNLCVGCEIQAETVDHFMICEAYSSESRVIDWKLLLENDTDVQYNIAEKVENRIKLRQKKIDEEGLASDSLAPMLQDISFLESNVT